MIKINPVDLFPLMDSISKIMQIISESPNPKRHLTKTIEAEIEGKKEFVVIMKVSFEKKEDAEKFVKLDELLDKTIMRL